MSLSSWKLRPAFGDPWGLKIPSVLFRFRTKQKPVPKMESKESLLGWGPGLLSLWLQGAAWLHCPEHVSGIGFCELGPRGLWYHITLGSGLCTKESLLKVCKRGSWGGSAYQWRTSKWEILVVVVPADQKCPTQCSFHSAAFCFLLSEDEVYLKVY